MRARVIREVSLALGWLSVFGIALALLALQDIYHGEPDLTLEWNMVRIALLIIIAFHGFALVALRKCHTEPDGLGVRVSAS